MDAHELKEVLTLEHQRTGSNAEYAAVLAPLVGTRVVVFTTTFFFGGTLAHVDAGHLLLREATLIFETGKFDRFLAGVGAPAPADVEQFPTDMDVPINMGAVVFVTPRRGAA